MINLDFNVVTLNKNTYLPIPTWLLVHILTKLIRINILNTYLPSIKRR